MLRQNVFAGTFYPADRAVLKNLLDSFWEKVENFSGCNLKAIVAPHAGYIYSGQVASYSYRALEKRVSKIPDTILIMAPTHYVEFYKVAVGVFEEYETPFGNLQGDVEFAKMLVKKFPQYFTDNIIPIVREHALETQLPFLKYVLKGLSPSKKIVPLVFGGVNPIEIGEVLLQFAEKVFFIVSSDLSHYNDYKLAVEKDKRTLDIFSSLDFDTAYVAADACGKVPRTTLTYIANKKNWKSKILKYMNSGDSIGDYSQPVVGYGSMIYCG